MDNRLSFVLRLSLKEIALRRLVVNLWNESDILLLIEKVLTFSAKHAGCFCKNRQGECPREWWETIHHKKPEQWREIVESKVRYKIQKLVLPDLLKKQILLIVTPVGLEIKSWKCFHERYLSFRDNLNSCVKFNASILAKLCWTTTGKIDYLKTAQKLMLCEELGVLNRYIIACLYCMEDFILHFWEKLPEEIKTEFYDEKGPPQFRTLNLEFYWPYILKGEQSKLDRFVRKPFRFALMRGMNGRWLHSSQVLHLDYKVKHPYSFNLVAFNEAALCRNKVATEYFFQKLTDEEKEVTLQITTDVMNAICISSHSEFPRGSLSDVVCYLLSSLTQNQQMTFIKETKVEFLCLLLEWPWQDLFLEIAERIWELLSEQDYDYLLGSIYSTIFYRTKHYFPELFQEFFSRSPIKFRKIFVHRECGPDIRTFPPSDQDLYIPDGNLFPIFFRNQDSDTIQVIFRNIDAEDRYRLVSWKDSFKLFCISILRGSWRMVEVCLREATLSEEDRERVKIGFFRFLEGIGIGENVCRDPKWKRFSELLDEIGTNFESKRSLEEETLCKVKKFCTHK